MVAWSRPFRIAGLKKDSKTRDQTGADGEMGQQVKPESMALPQKGNTQLLPEGVAEGIKSGNSWMKKSDQATSDGHWGRKGTNVGG